MKSLVKIGNRYDMQGKGRFSIEIYQFFQNDTIMYVCPHFRDEMASKGRN